MVEEYRSRSLLLKQYVGEAARRPCCQSLIPPADGLEMSKQEPDVKQ